MTEYIDKDMILEYLKIAATVRLPFEQFGIGFAMHAIQNTEPEDVRPVVRGEWLTTDAYPHNVYCSACYKIYAQTRWAVWEEGSLPRNFCPSCGADMRGGKP